MLRGVMYLALCHETSKGIAGLEDTFVSKAPDLFPNNTLQWEEKKSNTRMRSVH